ncbi:esterase-like activity of phytase family protein [Chitinophaga nivalis]|uniref:Esterase-like activity of phytase family protein n=1 Tax=Chitinophaga nivalis TaxID=2991709 RepID=A0ABT3IUW8_9BACT|nr:esterase-like activity of phytase family protein [Chitinophaga nivalis]MCW3462523.1 esterase-like activity of phytase family protein [Chitinophaga nivalis]MCW3487786.1 esterase-like activity of phytase family protein [Chitinophaga nivalis]
MKKYWLLWAVPLLSGIISCSSTRKTTQPVTGIGTLKFIGQYTLPHALSFNNTTVGGLSGIDYDAARQQYYLICDDRSERNPARFYTAKLYFSATAFDSVKITGVTTLRQPDGTAYPDFKTNPALTPDPEALRYNAKKNCMVWSSEGERIVTAKDTLLTNPGVYEISPDGRYIDSFALPAAFAMQAAENGPRRNGVFEGLGFTPDYKTTLVSLEEPRYEDGPRAGIHDTTAYTRIIRYDNRSRQPVAQYAYKLEPVAHPPTPANGFHVNGIADILVLSDHQLLSIERSFSVGVKNCTIKVFLTNLSGATDVSHINSLQQDTRFKPATKTLLFDFSVLGRYIDNIEGVTFGPRLPNGQQTLVFVADDNFSPAEESQFFLFALVPEKQ